MAINSPGRKSHFPYPLDPRYTPLWFPILTLLAGVTAYYRVFIGFSIWDDEGSLMLNVHQFLASKNLYGRLPDYGPVYYFYEWFLHRALGAPNTHDVARITTLIPWLLTALLCAWIVLRLTRSLLLASGAHIVSFWTLSFLRDMPGHPQEICILFITCLVATGIGAAVPRWRGLAMILLGAFTAALLLVKINIGVFMMLAVALALLSSVPKTLLSRTLFFSTATASVILPFVLMKAHLNQPITERYCLTVVTSTVTMLLFFCLRQESNLSLRHFWLALASFLSVTLMILLILIIGLRITLNAILYSLVSANFRVSVNAGNWYTPLRLHWIYVPWIMAGFLVGVFYLKNGNERRKNYFLLFLKFIVPSLAALSLLLGRSILDCVTPFCWLILCVPQNRTQSPERTIRSPDMESQPNGSSLPPSQLARTILCSVAVLQTLYAYPIAGRMPGFVDVLLIVVAAVCWGDFSRAQPVQRFLALVPVRRVILATLLFSVPLSYVVLGALQIKTYNSLTSLGFLGAEKIHVPAEQSRDYHWLVRNLQANCDIFFGVPELPSLHLWTNNYSPSGLVVDDWMIIYSDEDQAEISADLNSHPRSCVVYNPRILDFWNPSHTDMDALPLARYIHGNFKAAGTMDDFSLLVRKDRELSNIPSP